MPGNVFAMELSQLAAKQKRARDWQLFIEEAGNKDPAIYEQTSKLIKEFKAVLAKAALAGAISSELENQIVDLERRLEQLNEEARFA